MSWESEPFGVFDNGVYPHFKAISAISLNGRIMRNRVEVWGALISNTHVWDICYIALFVLISVLIGAHGRR